MHAVKNDTHVVYDYGREQTGGYNFFKEKRKFNCVKPGAQFSIFVRRWHESKLIKRRRLQKEEKIETRTCQQPNKNMSTTKQENG